MLHYNGGRVSRLSPVARVIILAALGFLIIVVLVYGFWLSRKVSGITKGIKSISLRTYQPLQENGMFSEIYGALNKMDRDLHRADQISEETETTRREWIANITHDLKTPLSPIKGYAELLADNSDKEKQTVQEYASVILKNINHTENLINDLKLTYQLDSGSIPFHPKEVRITRYVKEWVIDMVNDPAYTNRNIAFDSKIPEQSVTIDPGLFRRAVTNLITNALTHNPGDTKVILSTHIVSDVSYIADYILMMKNGRFLLGEPMETVTDHIKGKVWEILIDNREAGKYSRDFSVVSLRHENNMVRLRIVSDTAPAADAVAVEPSLEDLFLYHFRENAQSERSNDYAD